MSHFAKVENGVVVRVIVAEQAFIDTLPDAGTWVRTSYNTVAGKHPAKKPLRKNYAGVGFAYDQSRDAFIPPAPDMDFELDEETCTWVKKKTP